MNCHRKERQRMFLGKRLHKAIQWAWTLHCNACRDRNRGRFNLSLEWIADQLQWDTGRERLISLRAYKKNWLYSVLGLCCCNYFIRQGKMINCLNCDLNLCTDQKSLRQFLLKFMGQCVFFNFFVEAILTLKSWQHYCKHVLVKFVVS